MAGLAGYAGVGKYLSGTAIGVTGTAVAVAAPSRASSAWLTAEGAAYYYAINAGTASLSSPGHVPSGMNGYILPIQNLGTVAFYATAGTIHVQWFQDF